MSPDIDIEMIFPRESVAIVDNVECQVRDVSVIGKEDGVKVITLRTKRSEREGVALDDAIKQFMADFSEIEGGISSAKGVIRIGIFYDIKSYQYFPVLISRDNVNLLAKFNLEINVSVYPCT